MFVPVVLAVAAHAATDAPVSPEQYANELIEAWTCVDDMPQARFEGMARALQMQVLDLATEDDDYEDEDGATTCLTTLTLRAGQGCRITKSVLKDEDGDDYEQVDYRAVGAPRFVVLEVMVSRPCDVPDAYNFACSDDTSLRLGFSDAKQRTAVVNELLKITGFVHDKEWDCYRANATSDEPAGMVLQTDDDVDAGLYWVDILRM